MRRSAFSTARLVSVVASLMLISLVSFSMLSGAGAGPAAPAASAGVSTTPANVVALPEGYPWIRLAESARAAVVNVRVKTERTRGEEAVPEPFRRFLPRDPDAPRGERRGLGS